MSYIFVELSVRRRVDIWRTLPSTQVDRQEKLTLMEAGMSTRRRLDDWTLRRSERRRHLRIGQLRTQAAGDGGGDRARADLFDDVIYDYQAERVNAVISMPAPDRVKPGLHRSVIPTRLNNISIIRLDCSRAS